VTVTGATPPDVVAVYVTMTGNPFDETTVLFAGHVMVSVLVVGEWVTVTVKLQLATCPSFDLAVTDTFVVPTGKLLPDGGV
jgi:hypothetical protein